MKAEHFDILGVGFGPANIALAIYLREINCDKTFHFLENKPSASWQEEMLLENSDIQNHPLRDLVTPRNPMSKYTFTNFLKENDRLYEFLNLGLVFPYRKEYAQYIEWVAKDFDSSVTYNSKVTTIEAHNEDTYRVELDDGRLVTCDNLVFATGRTPYIPEIFETKISSRISHLTRYLSSLTKYESLINNSNNIAVIGGSQSAVEIILDLANRYPKVNIHGISRKQGYRMKDASPFMGRVYFPSFVKDFYESDEENRQRLKNHYHYTNYSAADLDVLDELYRLIYRQQYFGERKIFLHEGVSISDVNCEDNSVGLTLLEKNDETRHIEFDLVILATGFRDLGLKPNQEPYPKLLKNVETQLDLSHTGAIDVEYDYRVKTKNTSASLYLNGLCESSHGMGDAGSFSLLALRSKMIADSILENKVEVLDVLEKRYAN